MPNEEEKVLIQMAFKALETPLKTAFWAGALVGAKKGFSADLEAEFKAFMAKIIKEATSLPISNLGA